MGVASGCCPKERRESSSLCRHVNKSIKRERHVTLTSNEVINALNRAKDFSKLDLNQGYHQLELAPESRYLTTFSTHLGLRRFRRLNFGINCAAEIFQNAIREAISGLKGALNISDNVQPRTQGFLATAWP